MSLHVYPNVEQRSPEWFALRRGIITASTVGQLITPSIIKPANNDKSRGVIAQLVAERITGWTEPSYTSSDMMRGVLDEPIARAVYAEHYAPVTECGFMVNDDAGEPIGYSPDGLVGDDGLIEIKSRTPKAQVPLVIGCVVPPEHMAQVQCGLLVSGRSWCDYVSFCGGMALWVKRVLPDEQWFDAICEVAAKFEDIAREQADAYRAATDGLPMTERQTYDTDVVI